MEDRKNMSAYTIGLDFGTLSARGLLADVSDGRVRAQHEFIYPHGVMEQRLPDSTLLPAGWALHHPGDYLDALDAIIPELLRQSGVPAQQVIGIGTDATGSTVLTLTKEGVPLCFLEACRSRPHAWARLWKQQTAQDQADRITRLAQEREEHWLMDYGGRISATWMLPKALETLEEDPALYREAALFAEASDWLVWQLTGQFTRNECTAAYKALYGRGRGYPEPDFLQALHPQLGDFYHDKLAGEIQPLFGRAGGLTRPMAKRLGLQPGTAVAPGILDAHICAAGAGMTGPGEMLSILGTSGCHLLLGEAYHQLPGICGLAKDCILPGYYGYEAGQVCFGDHLAWLVDTIAPRDCVQEAQALGISAHEALSQKAARMMPGQCGLLALDWWNGNRSILIDSRLSGVLLGLGLHTKAEDIYRALLEGLAFGARLIVRLFDRQGLHVRSVRATGGISRKNPLAMQILADVLQLPVRVPLIQHGAAMGSAILAAVATGAQAGGYETTQQAISRMAPNACQAYAPNREHAAVYDSLFAEYERLHDAFGRGHDPVLKRLMDLRDDVLTTLHTDGKQP